MHHVRKHGTVVYGTCGDEQGSRRPGKAPHGGGGGRGSLDCPSPLLFLSEFPYM